MHRTCETRTRKRVKRFDDGLIGLLEEWKWGDKPVEEIMELIPVLTSGDLEAVRETIKMDHRTK